MAPHVDQPRRAGEPVLAARANRTLVLVPGELEGVGPPDGAAVIDPWPRPAEVELIWRPDLTANPKPPRFERAPYPYRVAVVPEIADASIWLDGAVVADLDEASRALGRLDGWAASAECEVIASPLLRAEAVSSSRMEGLNASHRAVAEATALPVETALPVATQTAQAIANNVRAMGEAIALTDLGPLTVDTIKEIHATLASVAQSLGKPGKIRDRQTWIGPSPHGPMNAVYVPPPPGEVPRLLDDLVRFSARDDVPAIVQAGVLHAQCQAIQPFAGDNGRVGRVLMQCVLRRRGASPRIVPPISVVLASHSKRYDDALAGYRQRGDLGAWTAYFAKTTTTSARRAEQLGVAIAALLADWRARAGTRARDSATDALLVMLIERPIVSAPTVSDGLGMGETVAGEGLAALERAGVVQRVAGANHTAWEATEVFDLLGRFEHDVYTDGDGRLGLTDEAPVSAPTTPAPRASVPRSST